MPESDCTKTVSVSKASTITLPATPSTGVTTRDVTITVTTETANAGACTTPPDLCWGTASVILVNTTTNAVVGTGSKNLVPKGPGSQPQSVTVPVVMVPGTPMGTYGIKHEVFCRFSDTALRDNEDNPY